MLKLDQITKNYLAGTNEVRALKGVNLEFRRSEFVSILGPSGCGKTTMLNIIGGLDKYTSGDLIINGVSTKQYADRDWDNYRNHSVGFVFQSYNLIPHQTVVGNVELALTLSGVGKREKRERAVAALERVGLGDQINKLPNQLSGGQMQRVAIARAIVNNPDIILADEPTGALDSETSVQVMQILKELSSDRLVIMVTHNPELAENYSTRIIRLMDGLVTEDSNPYSHDGDRVTEKAESAQELIAPEKAAAPVKADKEKRKADRKASMSIVTAFSLSLKNLFTKKARTILTAFAGSIGIIGIALILSLSAGFRAYIDNVQKDALSNYPLTITRETMDMSSFIKGGDDDKTLTAYPDDKTIISNGIMGETFNSILEGMSQNDMKAFKAYLEENVDMTKISDIKYSYNFQYHIYTAAGKKVNPYVMPDFDKTLQQMGGNMYGSLMQSVGTWSELMDNQELLESQYDLIGGDWPTAYNELVVVVDKYNRIPDYNLFQMGFKSEGELWLSVIEPVLRQAPQYSQYTDEQLHAIAVAYVESMGMSCAPTKTSFAFSEVIGTEYKLLIDSDYFAEKTNEQTGRKYYSAVDESSDDGKTHVSGKLENATTLRIAGIVRLKEGVSSGAIGSSIAYTKHLSDFVIEKLNSSAPITYQKENPSVDATTGALFELGASMENNLNKFGQVDKSDPDSISIYPTSFENKDYIVALIDEFNKDKPVDEHLKYTDYVGIMMDSITVIIDAITYVLIAFVSISLVVSSIMIGIITYISVLERTKEIGVLRSIGASKRDISRVFNAETLLVGFFAGMIGIGVTVVLNLILINPIIHSLAGISGVAKLPWIGGIALVLISMLLTLIAGLIPSGLAARKDPVVALRSE